MYRPYEGPGEGLLPLRKNRPSVSHVVVKGGRSEKLYLEAVRTELLRAGRALNHHNKQMICVYILYLYKYLNSHDHKVE